MPSFVWFAAWYYGLSVDDWLWPHLVFGGYAMLSTGVFFMGSDGGAGLADEILGIAPPQGHQQLAPPRQALPGPREAEPERFRFATWDDEEELRGR